MNDLPNLHLGWERLNDYADGRLDAASRRAAAAHLETCTECREALGELRCLLAAASDAPESIEPPPSLWREIEASIATRGERVQRDERVQAVVPRGVLAAPGYGRGWLAAAALALVVASSGVTVLVMHDRLGASAGGATTANAVREGEAGSAATTTTPPLLPASLAAAETSYLSELEALQRLFDRQRSVLSPSTLAVVERSLDTIDDAIGEARRALLADPSNGELARFLDSNYRQKVELLRRAAELPQRS